MTRRLRVLAQPDQPWLFSPRPPAVCMVGRKVAREQFLTRWLPYFPGLGPRRVDLLHKAGVYDWTQLHEALWLVPRHLRASICYELDLAFKALSDENAAHFITRLPRPQYWRIAATFPDNTLFLDIETTGLSRYYHQLTIIGWSTGGRFNVLINDGDKSALERLEHDLNRANVLVTFNGAHFDLPFLRAQLPGLPFPTAHVDLRHLSRRAGARGGQKRIELEFGVCRDDALRALTSSDAPGLWFRYQRGDLEALNLLLRYNHADVEGLRLLLAALAARAEPDLPLEWQPASLNLVVGKQLVTNAKTSVITVRPYIGKSGPRLKLSDLPSAERLTVVGIDLSGSSRAATGWASIHGSSATTMALRDDDEIISATLQAQPHLVSIDAPLSLPTGRNRVDDGDPARHQSGITRECERILRRRGVNVYPCLIKSMQSLTARGIRLAAQLRAHGVPVIESFPGAMQDILGMPRKRVSVELLKETISEYGLEGDFLQGRITHDELDALSSAIVGQLFWEGRYEPLGNEVEDFLIIPSLIGTVQLPELVIGISGHTGSGKTTIARLLSEKSFSDVSFSSVLASLFPRSDCKELERAELQLLGERVHEAPGQRWLEQQVMKRVLEHNLVTIDGLRFPEDHAFLVERLGRRFKHIHVTAPADVRRERFIKRGGTPEGYTRAVLSPTESHMDTLKSLAHFTIDNNGHIEQTRSSVEAILNAFVKGGS